MVNLKLMMKTCVLNFRGWTTLRVLRYLLLVILCKENIFQVVLRSCLNLNLLNWQKNYNIGLIIYIF